MNARRLLHRYGPAAFGLAALVFVLIIMEALIQTDVLDRYTIPPPSTVAAAFGRLVAEDNAIGRFAATAGETLAAGLLLCAVGIPLGMLFHRFLILRMACETWIGAMASAPIVLMYPLFLVMFGRSISTVVAMGFLPALPVVILKTIEGLAGTRPVLIRVGHSFHLSHRQILGKILLPAALPTIFTGIRIGLTFALVNIVGVEFLINFGGLGQLVNELSERYDLSGTYAAIGFVILVSTVFFVILEWIERHLVRGP